MAILQETLREKLKHFFWEVHPNKEQEAISYAKSIIDALVELNAFVPGKPEHAPGSLPEATQNYLGTRAENQIRLYSYDDARLGSEVLEKFTEEQWVVLQTVVRTITKM